MIKSSIIALVAVAAMGSVAAPAFADTGTTFDQDTRSYYEFPAASVLLRLQQSGVPATSVEQWGGLVRAYVVLPDGTQAMQFFTPDTLKPVLL